jgi:DNA-binding NtrC family response regulator
MARILVADDEQDLRDALRRVCEGDGHEVATAVNGREAVELVGTWRPDLAVLDVRMPFMSGLDALARIREVDPQLTVLIFSAYDDAAEVRRAVLELGAYGYLVKDSGVEAIRAKIQQGLRSRGILSDRVQSPHLAPDKRVGFGGLVGRSPAMLELIQLVRRISHSDVTVLIQGESGTGKELVARAIHDHSLRAGRSYVTVDCGTLPDTLAESEIFGYEAGAFTDARKSKPGKVELADGGTLFLDEIGNLSPSAQAKLLRVLEDRRVTRLGGHQVKEVDVRIVAATNLDLATAAQDRSFREDLYYRLNVFTFHLPPLRDRPEDVPLLVEHFTERFAEEQAKELTGGVSEEAMALLATYRWPGNVRELRNVMERAVLLADTQVSPAHLPANLVRAGEPAPGGPARHPHAGVATPAVATPDGIVLRAVDLDRVPLKEAKRMAGEAVERAYILAALKRAHWNKSKAARLLGLNYKTLREKVREHDLDRLRYE